MKKILLVLLICGISSLARAEDPYIIEVKSLGAVSGQGMACNASKYKTFEMLARAILITKAYSDQEQAVAMKAYNDEKANAYLSKQMDGFNDCANIARRFDRQDIFNVTLYADGTIKMPDGKIFTPRTPYDATLVYDVSDNEKNRADKIYSTKEDKPVKITVKDDRLEGEGTTVTITPPVKRSGTAATLNAPINSGAVTAPRKAAPTSKAVDDGSIKRISRPK